MKLLLDTLSLLYPKRCTTCSSELLSNELILCTYCRHDLPIICYNDFKDNKIKNAFYGKVPIEKASAFLYYRKEGKTKTLIHHLKYKGRQDIGSFLGNWFGSILRTSNAFNDIDHIIPVPLHKKKLRQRGYNQVTTFGKALAKQLQKKYTPYQLLRISPSKTQTLKQRFERFHNQDTRFKNIQPSTFTNKHLLLIDDVITTGATLEACCHELLKSRNVKISIATMAYTE